MAAALPNLCSADIYTGDTMATSSLPFPSLQIVSSTAAAAAAAAAKKKRRPAGTPDPDAEVVSLSPRTLLESDRYVCEICNQGFQRDQNLQMHRRRHKVPWKLLKREGGAGPGRKRVFVCPEPSCLHHDPCHALGDLVGIKKHFRRKHSGSRQWACARCAKAYAVQSDYKAHLKTCGTRGHSCDCGRVFSRVESFIEHQDTCNAGRACGTELPTPRSGLSRATSSPSPSSPTEWASLITPPSNWSAVFLQPDRDQAPDPAPVPHVELQLLPPSGAHSSSFALASAVRRPAFDETHVTKLQLSIGLGDSEPEFAAVRLREEAREQNELAMAEKAMADDMRMWAKREVEMAEEEFANSRRIRNQAHAELCRARTDRDHSVAKINEALLQITCYACKQKFRARAAMSSEVGSYISVVTEGGEDHCDDEHPGGAEKSGTYAGSCPCLFLPRP